MDSKTANFSGISCEDAKGLIEPCATKITDPVSWGRLLQHLRGCIFCKHAFVKYHKIVIADIADKVISREIQAGHRHYALAEEVAMHFTQAQLEEFGTQMEAAEKKGTFTEDELVLIEQHVAVCAACKKMVPGTK